MMKTTDTNQVGIACVVSRHLYSFIMDHRDFVFVFVFCIILTDDYDGYESGKDCIRCFLPSVLFKEQLSESSELSSIK
jgi:hypothetical protein